MDDTITLRRGDIQRLLSPPSRPDPHIPEKTLGEGSQVVYLYYNPSERALYELLGHPYWPCKVGMTYGPDGWARISTQKYSAAFSHTPVYALELRTDDAFQLEIQLKAALEMKFRRVREALGNEWFLTTPEEVEVIWAERDHLPLPICRSPRVSDFKWAEVLTEGDVRAVWGALQDHIEALRRKDVLDHRQRKTLRSLLVTLHIIYLTCLTGAEMSEVSRLTWEDFHEVEHGFEIRVTRRFGRGCVYFLPPDYVALLKADMGEGVRIFDRTDRVIQKNLSALGQDVGIDGLCHRVLRQNVDRLGLRGRWPLFERGAVTVKDYARKHWRAAWEARNDPTQAIPHSDGENSAQALAYLVRKGWLEMRGAAGFSLADRVFDRVVEGKAKGVPREVGALIAQLPDD